MSYALSFLIGGAMFWAAYLMAGFEGGIVLAVLLLAIEVIHDLRLHRPGGGAT